MLPDHGRAVLRGLAALVAVVTTACAVAAPPEFASPAAPPPSLVLGEFVDDYGSRYTISADEWFHHPAIRYRVVTWNLDQQYAIAQNAPSNLRSANLWTRIDWMPLRGMPPYEWAFCLSAYEAPSGGRGGGDRDRAARAADDGVQRVPVLADAPHSGWRAGLRRHV